MEKKKANRERDRIKEKGKGGDIDRELGWEESERDMIEKVKGGIWLGTRKEGMGRVIDGEKLLSFLTLERALYTIFSRTLFSIRWECE